MFVTVAKRTIKFIFLLPATFFVKLGWSAVQYAFNYKQLHQIIWICVYF